MINIKSYVKSEVESLAKASKVDLTADRIEGIVDSVLFDWNEIGDPYSDLGKVIEWNLDQNLTHC